MNLSEIHYPRSMLEFMNLLEKEKRVQIISGATTFGVDQRSRYLSFEPSIACTHYIPDLASIHKTERMISIGAACTLTGLEHVYPFDRDQARELLRTIGTSAVRNVATIGGHIMYPKRFLSLWALLASLDAEVEFRSPSRTITKNIWYLADQDGHPLWEQNRLLARIRVPLQSLDHLYIRRIGAGIFPEGDGAYLVSAATIDSRSVTNFKLVIAGERAFRDYEAEQRVASSPFPLSNKTLQIVIRQYGESLRKSGYWNIDVVLPLVAQALEDLQRTGT